MPPKSKQKKAPTNPSAPPLLLEQPLNPTTTTQEDLVVAGQRKINLIWEATQAIVAVSITLAMIYCATNKIESKELNYAFFLIVTMYFVRTNHTKIGGVSQNNVSYGIYDRLTYYMCLFSY